MTHEHFYADANDKQTGHKPLTPKNKGTLLVYIVP